MKKDKPTYAFDTDGHTVVEWDSEKTEPTHSRTEPIHSRLDFNYLLAGSLLVDLSAAIIIILCIVSAMIGNNTTPDITLALGLPVILGIFGIAFGAMFMFLSCVEWVFS